MSTSNVLKKKLLFFRNNRFYPRSHQLSSHQTEPIVPKRPRAYRHLTLEYKQIPPTSIIVARIRLYSRLFLIHLSKNLRLMTFLQEKHHDWLKKDNTLNTRIEDLSKNIYFICICNFFTIFVMIKKRRFYIDTYTSIIKQFIIYIYLSCKTILSIQDQ